MFVSTISILKITSGRVVTTGYDAAGWVFSVTGAAPYLQARYYNAAGQVEESVLGNGRVETAVYNSRLQPESLEVNGGVMRLGYSYGTGDNNGNVRTQSITLGGLSYTHTFTYDPLNRLQSAIDSRGVWSQGYGYDQYGNRWVSWGYVPNPSLPPVNQGAYLAARNRLTSSAGYGYDAAGNITSDPLARTFTYDSENRQTSSSAGASQYFYDGEGRRVKKRSNGVETIYIYNAFGRLVAEYGGAPSTRAVLFVHTDHLGSTRAVTNETGGVQKTHHYLPFGEIVLSTGSGQDVNSKFKGQERDSESGLDFFGARYYSGPQGRSTNPYPLVWLDKRLNLTINRRDEGPSSKDEYLRDPQKPRTLHDTTRQTRASSFW
ncbi:MAG: RHS repeat domain-containing protein [Acidobacteriota bacterium]